MIQDWEIEDIRKHLLSTVEGVERTILATTFDGWVEDWEASYTDESVDDFVQGQTKELREKVAKLEKEILTLKEPPKVEEPPKEEEPINTLQVDGREVQELKQVLRFYADPDTYNGFFASGISGALGEDYSKVDGEPVPGARAREILQTGGI